MRYDHQQRAFGHWRNSRRRFHWFGLVSVLMTMTIPVMAAGEVQKRVLVFYATRQEAPASMIGERIFQKTLGEGLAGNLDYYTEFIDVARFSEPGYQTALSDFLRHKYDKNRLDLIIATSGTSIEFMQRFGAQLFPGTPTVFIGGEDKRPLPNATGLSTRINMKSTLEVALELQPSTKQVFVVSGASDFDKFYETVARQDFKEFEGRVVFTYLTGQSMAELRQQVANLPPDSIIYFLAVVEDGAGYRFLPTDSLDQISAVANAPIYCWNEVAVGHGIVGGNLMSLEIVAQKTADLALRVLRGEKPETIPVVEANINVPMFDWRQLRRWGIDESKLPAGSIVRFKEPTVWEQYRWRILGVLSLCVFEGILILVLLINRNRRRQVELENERLASVAEAERKHLDEVVSNVPGIVWESRLEPDGTTRKAQFVSDYVEKMLGYSVDEWLATPGFWLSIIPEDDRETASQCSEAVFASGESGIVQFRWRTKDGRLLWVEEHLEAICDDNGKSVGLRGVTLNINERKQAEESLRQSETRFRNMADTAPVMIWISGPDKLCTYFNQGWLDFTGRTMEQELGNGWAEGVYSEDYSHCLEVYESSFDRREPFKMEYRLRRYDGKFRWVYDSGTPRFSSEGTFLGYIGSCIDIADRKEAEEALQVAHEEVSRLKNQLQEENIYLQEEIRLAHHLDEIIGHSNSIKYVLFKIEQVAQTDTTVLILGETGTGKELVARAIHSQSLRKERPLVKVNCAALSGSLIESELFGHEKGAFTGASARKIGRFELADGATIFLDEIGELPLELQSKLLRVLQEGEIERLGSSKTIKVDVRIIAATNRDMKLEVEKGNFREDLWYRLNVFPITVPPLKQRKEDIPAMVEHFVSTFSKKVGKTITSVSSATMKKFQDYSWPGNVRELANVIERAVVTAQGSVLRIADQFEQQQPRDLSDPTKTLEEIEKEHITRILDQTAGRVEGPSGAARILGLNPSTLRTRMAKLGIQKSIRTFAGSSRGAN